MVGLIAFANNSGLGAQTRRLAHLIKPDRILVVDASPFSDNKEVHLEWYKDFNCIVSRGFPSNEDIKKFLEGLDYVLTCENPFNFNLVWWGQKQGTKIFCQANYEFCENLSKPYLPIPDKFLMPSYWKMQDMEDRFGKDKVSYLPPPIDPVEFEEVRKINMKRSGKRFLHIVGTVAHLDRNGTLDLLEAVKLCKSDFELVIKTQHPLPEEYQLIDPRVKYELTEVEDVAELYKGFDALILPRRYGGLSLTTNEALMSGLPVIMTDTSPNNTLLPKNWLVPARRVTYFPSRSLIAVYSADYQKLADKIDEFAKGIRIASKSLAYKIAWANFSDQVLQQNYLELFNKG